MICRPAKCTGILAGLVIGATLLGVNLLILQGLLRQALGLGFYLTMLAFMGSVVLFVVWLHRFARLLALRYELDRNALAIYTGLATYIIPLNAVERVMTGAGWALRRFRGFEWPGCVQGRALVDGLPPLHLLGTEPVERQLVVVTRQAAYGISPPAGSDFVSALRARQALGVIRPVEETIAQDSLATWPVWRDRALWAIVGLALIANLSLFGLILSRYQALPERISIHYNALGEVDRISQKAWLLAVPFIGALALVVNTLLGLVLHPRERVGSIMLGGATLVLQAVLWLAALGILVT